MEAFNNEDKEFSVFRKIVISCFVISVIAFSYSQILSTDKALNKTYEKGYAAGFEAGNEKGYSNGYYRGYYEMGFQPFNHPDSLVYSSHYKRLNP